jgi:hypothetical protein
VIVTLTATITTPTREASAGICAADPYSAGCAGYRGAVAVRQPVGACRYVVVGGVRVRHSV